MRKQLTDQAVARIAPPLDKAQEDYFDTVLPSFGLRIAKTGTRSWFVMTRILDQGKRKLRRVTLGRYPGVSLAEARELGRKALALASTGAEAAEVLGVRQDREAAKIAASRNTFGMVAKDFLDRYRLSRGPRKGQRPKPETLSSMRQCLTGPTFAGWAERKLDEITRRDVQEALDRVLEAGHDRTANLALDVLRILFDWAIERDIVETNPARLVRRPAAARSRSRVLSLDELRRLWEATFAPEIAAPFAAHAAITRMLMLTGQRRGEVAGMPWREIDRERRLWILPASRNKANREHLVPLSDAAETIIEAQPKRGVLVFPSTTGGEVRSWESYRQRLDERLPLEEHWVIHDLRRSVVTHMNEALRIPPHIVESVVNHASGFQNGVAGVYNRAQYLDERRSALDAWARLLLDAGVPVNVVEMRR